MRKPTLPILWKNEPWIDHLAKLSEEFTELCCELHDIDVGNNADALVSEALDLIQVAIGTIDKAVNEHGVDFETALRTHTEKLTGRGWSIKGWIELDINKCRG